MSVYADYFVVWVVGVVCGVLVSLVVSRAKVAKVDIHVEPDVLTPDIASLLQSIRLQLVWRRAKHISIEWDAAVRNAVLGHYIPLTLKLGDRKLTLAIDGNYQIQEGRIVRPIIVSLLRDNARAEIGGRPKNA